MTRLNRTFSVNKVERAPTKVLRCLPPMSISSPWIHTGLKFCTNTRNSHLLHLIWGAIYAICGVIQFVAGIYFMLELPIFHIGSNIWTGSWNCFSGIVIILMGCAGTVTSRRAQCFLLLSSLVAVCNLGNLLILEMGEWRGFLDPQDRQFIKEKGLDALMYSAYLCTTTCTVIAMITSFLAFQHAFFYKKLLSRKETISVMKQRGSMGNSSLPNGNILHHHHHFFDHRAEHELEQDDNDSVLRQGQQPQDLIKRHDDELNLKTPNGPQPHPTWVYRHNYAPFTLAKSVATTTTSATVKRTLSFLKTGKENQGSQQQALLTSPPTSSAGGGLPTISESVSQREQLANGKGRHAVIRRHQSMYIHPRATELLPPFNVSSSSNEVPTFNMHEVSGKSEVRPIVTLKRSKTTVGQSSGFGNGNNPTLHYRGASTLQPPRTFRSNSNAPKKPLFDHNHNIYGTNKRGSSLASGSKAHHHHYANAHLLDDICEFQAGPSFDLPDREKMRRYGWSNGNITANGNCVLLETELHHSRGTSSSYLRRPQEDLSTDSCGENIRYQAVEGLVQANNRHHKIGQDHNSNHLLRAGTAQYSSSMENLLSERSRDDMDSTVVGGGGGGMVKYGSTGSISSIGSTLLDNHNPMTMMMHGARQATYTPSSLYSQDSSNIPTMYFGKMSSTESVLIYDAIPKKSGTALKKSNSRVSSTGKLRLRVESFRNNKSSSGTQTDISATMKNKKYQADTNDNNSTDNNAAATSEAKYTAQYKKNTAPNKPARKHKPKAGSDPHNSPNAGGGESRSDRSASPDNSSTSGYSSPSAGLHSKESSPCGSKIPSPPYSLENSNQVSATTANDNDDDNDEELAEEPSDNRITVIQIEGEKSGQLDDVQGSLDEGASMESPPPPPVAKIIDAKTLPFVRQTRRELPRIATNGTLGKPTQKRKLPDRTSTSRDLPEPPTSTPQRLYQQQRLFRSNLPRPAPIHQFGPSTGNHRVPLPPVPELERSDHERESMSPTPSAHSSAPSPRFRPLPSPLTTPVQPASGGRLSGKPRRNNALSPSRIPEPRGEPNTASQNNGVEERLRILLSLLESGKEDVQNGVVREDTLQYLSQLETVARRLKDQLLSENNDQNEKVMRSSPSSKIVPNMESEC